MSEIDDILLFKQYQELDLALTAADFWHFAPRYIITVDEENKCKRKFPTREWTGRARTSDYLGRFSDLIDNNQIVIINKIRRMLISLTVMSKFFHKAKFAGTGLPGTTDAYAAAIMSVDEDQAKYQLSRVLQMHDDLPQWLKYVNPIKTKNSLMLQWECGGKIQAFSLKEKGAIGYGFSEVLFDEAAFQQFARSTYEGTRPSIGEKGKIIIVSTPNGKRNWFYEVWANVDDNYPSVKRMKIDWREHPDHDDEWYHSMESTMDAQAFARQYLCSFTSSFGRAVFRGEYEDRLHAPEDDMATSFIPGKPVLVGWDLGYMAPAAVFCQFNSKQQLVAQHEKIGSQIEIHTFAKNVREARSAWYPRGTDYIHFVPHDAFRNFRAEAKHGHVNDYQVLFATPSVSAGIEKGVFFGEQAYRGAVQIEVRLGAVRKLLRLRDDGRAGFLISKTGCPELVDGFNGGYVYKEGTRGGDPDKLEPDKNCDYSDVSDALQMIATGYPNVMSTLEKQQTKQTAERLSTRRFRIGT
jgi:hypothetical protein